MTDKQRDEVLECSAVFLIFASFVGFVYFLVRFGYALVAHHELRFVSDTIIFLVAFAVMCGYVSSVDDAKVASEEKSREGDE